MSTTVVDTGKLQDGIYLSPAARPPKSLIFLTLAFGAEDRKSVV